MLVLNAKPGERIILTCPDGQQVEITIHRNSNPGFTRLCFNGHRSVQIDRESVAIKKGLMPKA